MGKVPVRRKLIKGGDDDKFEVEILILLKWNLMIGKEDFRCSQKC